MRSLIFIALCAGTLLAGCAMVEPSPHPANNVTVQSNWRRTAEGWEVFPRRPVPRAWYAAALHPALAALLIGQLAVACLVALPDASRRGATIGG